MDILSHAVAGAVSGAYFGRPFLGAVMGVLPDVALGVKRRITPPQAYDMMHSLTYVLTVPATFYIVTGDMLVVLAVFFALLSHIILDLPTHGKQWAPPLLYPFSKQRFSFGNEWEFFNQAWFNGLGITFLWTLSWILLSQYDIGYQLLLSAL